MRELHSHKVNGCNESLRIEVIDGPGHGGACHRYDITGFETLNNPGTERNGYPLSCSRLPIIFQNGPIREAGVNGVTHEALLAILIDRLEGFQSGKYACDENASALAHMREAQAILKQRTKKRLAQGVEGTHQI